MENMLRFLMVLFAVFMPSVLFGQTTANPEANPKVDGKEAKGPDWPAEIWVRFENFEISMKSPLRSDLSVNKPPSVYIVCKKNGKEVGKCPYLLGWGGNYPNGNNYDVLIGDGANDEYTLEVWDSQYRKDQPLFEIGPFKGSEWREKLTDPVTKRLEEGKVIKFDSSDKDKLSSVSLSYAGTRVWYRLNNVTIPPNSLHKNNDAINKPPQLRVSLYEEGEKLKGQSTYHRGWAADFPKVTANCWAVREGTKRVYSVEVWDNQVFGYALIFKTIGLSVDKFRDKIYEPAGPNFPEDRLSFLVFEKIKGPF